MMDISIHMEILGVEGVGNFVTGYPSVKKPNRTRVPAILTLVTAGRPVIDRSA